jgi:hypothetical protein
MDPSEINIQSRASAYECQDPHSIIEQQVQLLKDSMVRRKTHHKLMLRGKNSFFSSLDQF